VSIRKGGLSVPSNTFFLTFCLPQIPEYVYAGKFLRIKVDLYIPTPLRCFNCQTFGHSKDKCSHSAVCGSCGKGTHEGASCTAKPNCVNCGGEHGPSSRTCPKFLVEQEIQKVKTVKKISFFDARKEVEGSAPVQQRTLYSRILSAHKKVSTSEIGVQVKPQTKEMCIQTDVTWVKSEQPATMLEVASQSTQASVDVSLPIITFKSNGKSECSAASSKKEKLNEKATVKLVNLGNKARLSQTSLKRLGPLASPKSGPRDTKAKSRSDRIKKGERGFANLPKNVTDVLMIEEDAELEFEDNYQRPPEADTGSDPLFSGTDKERGVAPS